MFKTALNNILPHIWKLANIVPIPKPSKDIDKGTSYRAISLLSVSAKTLEKILVPYITANIPNTPMQHGYNTHHYTVTALHTLNNTVAKGFNEMAPTARTITVALDKSKYFDTMNTHTKQKAATDQHSRHNHDVYRNHIKGRKAYTKYRKHTAIQCQLKTGVLKVTSSHPHYLTFRLQTYHHPEHRFRACRTQIKSHPQTQARVQPIYTYNHTCIHTVLAWTKKNLTAHQGIF